MVRYHDGPVALIVVERGEELAAQQRLAGADFAGDLDEAFAAFEGELDDFQSLVVAIESAGRRVLLTGALEGGALADFVEAGPGRCDVLVAPHHGSLEGLPLALARSTEPR